MADWAVQSLTKLLANLQQEKEKDHQNAPLIIMTKSSDIVIDLLSSPIKI